MSNAWRYLNHCPRYHGGLSKWENIALKRGNRSWFYDKRPHFDHTRTYGERGWAGGWPFNRDSGYRRMRRQQRKQARRKNKRLIEQERELAA